MKKPAKVTIKCTQNQKETLNGVNVVDKSFKFIKHGIVYYIVNPSYTNGPKSKTYCHQQFGFCLV